MISVVCVDYSRTVCLAENSCTTVFSHSVRVSIVRLCVVVVVRDVKICGLVKFDVLPEWGCYARLLNEVIALVFSSCK